MPADVLFHKYNLSRTDGKPVRDCFVLELKDPNAMHALRAYADACEKSHPELAEDLREKYDLMRGIIVESAPHPYGLNWFFAADWNPKTGRYATRDQVQIFSRGLEKPIAWAHPGEIEAAVTMQAQGRHDGQITVSAIPQDGYVPLYPAGAK